MATAPLQRYQATTPTSHHRVFERSGCTFWVVPAHICGVPREARVSVCAIRWSLLSEHVWPKFSGVAFHTHMVALLIQAAARCRRCRRGRRSTNKTHCEAHASPLAFIQARTGTRGNLAGRARTQCKHSHTCTAAPRTNGFLGTQHTQSYISECCVDNSEATFRRVRRGVPTNAGTYVAQQQRINGAASWRHGRRQGRLASRRGTVHIIWAACTKLARVQKLRARRYRTSSFQAISSPWVGCIRTQRSMPVAARSTCTCRRTSKA